DKRREIDIGQIADGQEVIGHAAEQRDGGHQQRSRDRPANEDLGDIHDPTFTLLPGMSRTWPSVTTFSPGSTPFSTATSFSVRSETVIGRCSTRLSAFRTKTYSSYWLTSTSCGGMTAAF